VLKEQQQKTQKEENKMVYYIDCKDWIDDRGLEDEDWVHDRDLR
jgi:hypothetical protein